MSAIAPIAVDRVQRAVKAPRFMVFTVTIQAGGRIDCTFDADSFPLNDLNQARRMIEAEIKKFRLKILGETAPPAAASGPAPNRKARARKSRRDGT